ncbi:MAG: hypothetical protein GX197_09565 [Firmicutes bacterium]|nr:hypothetical protein [Bacillota bacterium]
MRRMLLAALSLVLLFLSGCHGHKEHATGQETELHVAAMAGPITLNPLFLRDSASAEVASLLHATLLVTDPDTLAPQPHLVSSWEVLEDNLTYIFTLHENAYWTDGLPITAEDAAFTMRVICHPDYTGWLFLPLQYVAGAQEYKQNHQSLFADGFIAGIKVLDEKTFSITLKEPYAPFLSFLTFPLLPAHLLSSVEVRRLEAHEYSFKLPVSSGPYLLAAWDTDEYVHVKANPNFFLGKPKIEHIYYRFVPNVETQVIELLAGKLDLIPTAVKVEDVSRLQADPQIKIYTNPRLVYDYIAINTKKDSPLQDRRVRQALATLVDRREIVNNVLLGFADPLYGPLLPLHFAYDRSLHTEAVDLAAARELLVAAGYKNLQLNLVFNAGNLVRENVALLLKEQAAKIGIDIQLSLLEWEAFLAAINEGDYELAILGRGVEADPDLTYHWHSESLGNALGYKNEEVDILLEQAIKATTQEERATLYRQAQKKIVADIPAIWLYSRQAIHAVSAAVENFRPHPESVFFNVHEWTLKAEEENM